jgi:hypothetical protein
LVAWSCNIPVTAFVLDLDGLPCLKTIILKDSPSYGLLSGPSAWISAPPYEAVGVDRRPVAAPKEEEQEAAGGTDEGRQRTSDSAK